MWGSTYYTLLPSSPPNPKLNHGESTRTLQLRRKMPKKLDHVQLRSKHTPQFVGTGGRQHSSKEALKESGRDTHSPGESSTLISCLSSARRNRSMFLGEMWFPEELAPQLILEAQTLVHWAEGFPSQRKCVTPGRSFPDPFSKQQAGQSNGSRSFVPGAAGDTQQRDTKVRFPTACPLCPEAQT